MIYHNDLSENNRFYSCEKSLQYIRHVIVMNY